MSSKKSLSSRVKLFMVVIVAFLCGGVIGSVQRCPGRYCGRQIDDKGIALDCGACPRGYHSNGTYCSLCTNSPSLYDWLYLGFMALLAVILHWFFIDMFAQNSRLCCKVAMCISALIECILAAVFSLLLTEPIGSLNLRSCRIKQISDWYTVFFNPKPNYVDTIYCTQEAVYPLYTLVLVYYAFATLLLFLIRLLLLSRLSRCHGKASVYAALYFLPGLVTVHAVLGGVIYYSFPYVTLVVSVLSISLVLAKNKITNVSQLVKSRRHVCIVLAHWLMHAYGLLAVTQLRNPAVDGPLFVLVAAPAFFYLGTTQLTNPNKFTNT